MPPGMISFIHVNMTWQSSVRRTRICIGCVMKPPAEVLMCANSCYSPEHGENFWGTVVQARVKEDQCEGVVRVAYARRL